MLVHPFIKSADDDASSKLNGQETHIPVNQPPRTALAEHYSPDILKKKLSHTLTLPSVGGGKEGLLQVVEQTLKYSVNTWDQGFLDKLYSSTNSVSDFLM